MTVKKEILIEAQNVEECFALHTKRVYNDPVNIEERDLIVDDTNKWLERALDEITQIPSNTQVQVELVISAVRKMEVIEDE